MPIGLYFRPTGFTPGIYDSVLKQLDQAGGWSGSMPHSRLTSAIAQSMS